MAETCRFGADCRIDQRITELAGNCNKMPGESCGAIAAYATLISAYGSLAGLDEEAKINGIFVFSRVPTTMPRSARPQDWVGAVLPVRRLSEQPSGRIDISPADAALGMMASGRFVASDWFTRTLNPLDVHTPDLRLRLTDGSVEELGSLTSREYYGGLVGNPVILRAVESAFVTTG